MTNVVSRSTMNNLLKCDHKGTTKSLLCDNPECWEAKGISSRLIEKHMKGIKSFGYLILHPHDADDFSRCVEIVNKHGWGPRLGEMRAYGYVWARIVANWNQMESWLNAGSYDKINELLAVLDVIGGRLKRFEPNPEEIPGLVHHKDWVIGSTLVQPEHQYDEADVCPCVVLESFPNTSIKYYTRDGKVKGFKTAKYTAKLKLSDSLDGSKEDSSLVRGILGTMDRFVRSNTSQWFSSSFAPVHHYSFDGADTTSMYFSQVYKLDESEDVGYCLISIPQSHPLDPSLKSEEEWMCEFGGYKWVVSPLPVRPYSLYLTDGLLNACEDLESDLDKVLGSNRLEFESDDSVDSPTNPTESTSQTESTDQNKPTSQTEPTESTKSTEPTDKANSLPTVFACVTLG